MSIIVGFVPTPAGEAALTAGIAEATLRNEDLVIVNSAREGALVDKAVATAEAPGGGGAARHGRRRHDVRAAAPVPARSGR